ncbi:MAG TPA: hypothetical protein VFP66_12600 [Candidatus Limnocylindrales bacterium]|nr:hypothetical protein [Candidatus Limnocylindrales bacterium]
MENDGKTKARRRRRGAGKTWADVAMYPYRDREARADTRGRLMIVISVIESIEVRRTRPRTRWTPTDALSNTVS